MNVNLGIKLGSVLVLGIGVGLMGTAAAEAEPAVPGRLVEPPLLEGAADATAQEGEEILVLPFTDVPTDHWAYQVLLNLAGVYGCVGGYSDGTFRGDNAVTRYEFAAGMDACLSIMTELIQQRQAEQDQVVGELIQDMERSLDELRQLEGDIETLEQN
ncbi:MAG: S-layer homology domain-containing protein [Leptolyngbyaceae cyanobacterium SM2_5_2]|nr:S-layer homology domain-containing protein [Leptolyngbyaceae cyanobacterium SM2_5_2]